MPAHSFALLVRGADLMAGEHFDALQQGGCDDAVIGEREGSCFADFTRRAPNFAAAVASAIEELERAVPGAVVVRVEPDELVTSADVAARTGRSRESIRLYSDGRRRHGFPPPVSWIGGRQRLWLWADVAAWFARELDEQFPSNEAGQFVAALNAVLELRWRNDKLDDDERVSIARLIPAELRAQVDPVVASA